MNQNENRGRGFPIIAVILGLVLLFAFLTQQTPQNGQYYEIVQLFKDEKIESFDLNLSSGLLEYSIAGEEDETHTYTVPDVELFIWDIHDYIDQYNEAHPNDPLEYNYRVRSSVWMTLLNLIPTLLMVVMFFFLISMMSQQGGGRGIGSIGKARTKTEQDSSRKATFADVAGADEEKLELQEIVEYLKNPTVFSSLGAKIPKGVLLVGPPGTGKTLLARAVAGEANVPFFSISGSDFVELYVGVGASRVRDLFDKAKKSRPSIIFIDEIDAVGRRRGAGLGGGHDEREQTLNQLLVEMDGFSGNDGVIIMAATNRADILDPALLRPGRFDRQIYVGAPDIKGREEILKVHARNKPLGPDINLKTIAKETPGFTGADLENLLNEAALLAARKKRRAITQEDIEEATIKVVAGPEKKSHVVTPKEKRLTAFHEAGHAVAHFYATPETPVHQISIIPRGAAGGYTMSLPAEDSNYSTKRQMENEIVTLLGGRVAEQLVLNDISTGASNDLQRATEVARNMVTKYGFSDKIGPVVYSHSDEVFLGRDFAQQRNYSEEIASEIDVEVKHIITHAYSTCEQILTEHMDQLSAVAGQLLENEKMDGEVFNAFMASGAKYFPGTEPTIEEKSSAAEETEEQKPEETPAEVTAEAAEEKTAEAPVEEKPAEAEE